MELNFTGTIDEFHALFPTADASVLAQVTHILETLTVTGQKLESIMATEAENLAIIQEVSDKLDATNVALGKIGSETTGLLAAVAGLKTAVADLEARLAAGGSSPAIDAALANVRAKVTAVFDAAVSVDNLVPDVAPAP
jgi:hypothetical protein